MTARPLPLQQNPPAPAPRPLETLMTAAEVAKEIRVRPKRVYELGIPCVKLSERCLRWRRSEVEQWVAEREQPRGR